MYLHLYQNDSNLFILIVYNIYNALHRVAYYFLVKNADLSLNIIFYLAL